MQCDGYVSAVTSSGPHSPARSFSLELLEMTRYFFEAELSWTTLAVYSQQLKKPTRQPNSWRMILL
jgi:hypothetical protein